jgi:enolase
MSKIVGAISSSAPPSLRFAPDLKSNEEALDVIVEAIRKAGYEPGEDVFMALDVAATELYKDGKYFFSSTGQSLTTEETIAFYEKLTADYPVISIEDGLAEDDWDGWAMSAWVKRFSWWGMTSLSPIRSA